MIQLNLLPNVKQEYIKTQRVKSLMMFVSFVSSAIAVGILILSASAVYLVQRKVINDLSSSIKSSSTLQSQPNISNILTVQSQLNSLAALDAQKPVTSRIFGYLAELTPTQATISDLQVDYTLNTMTISGNAPGLDVVNTFVDGLKFTNYTVQGSTTSQPAFSTVVLSSFSRSSKSATYTITFGFDPTIFNVADNVTLTVGNQTPPAQQPSIIFKKGS